MSANWGGEQTSERQARWVVLGILFIILCSWRATAQSSTTFHNSDGTTTKITAVCDSNGDCAVWDSTHELGIMARRKLLKAEKDYCKSISLPINEVKAYDSDTMLGGKNINPACLAAYQSK